MNIMEFIAALVDSLAWPVAVVVLVLIARPALNDIAKRIRNLRYAGLEADLQLLDQVGADHTALPPAVRSDQMAQLIATAPGAAIEQAWRRVRDAVGYAGYSVTTEPDLSLTDALEALLRDGIISPADVSLYNVLSAIRQRAYYEGADFPAAVALDFVNKADALASKIREATEPPSPDA